jgi:Gpi18-like mannosyltransferase
MKFDFIKKHHLKIIFISVTIKITYFLFLFFLRKSEVIKGDFGFNLDSFFSTFFRNDSGWYKYITLEGYARLSNKEDLKGIVNGVFDQSEWAFFPLYPYLIKILMYSGLSYFVSSFLFALVFSTICFIVFFEFVLYTFKDKEKAWFCTLLFILFPFNYYYSMFYTEALFGFLMISGFLCVLKNRNKWLCFIIPSLVLTRPNGLVVSFVLFLYFLEYYFKDKKPSIGLLINKDLFLKILPFTLAPITLFFYCLYQYEMTGDYFAFNSAQEGWEKKDMWPWQALFGRGDFATQFNSIFVCTVLLFFGFTIKRYSFSLIILILFTILMPLSKGSATSMPRYMSILFPFFIVASQYLFNFKYKYFVLGVFYILQLNNLYFWYNYHPFSY